MAPIGHRIPLAFCILPLTAILDMAGCIEAMSQCVSHAQQTVKRRADSLMDVVVCMNVYVCQRDRESEDMYRKYSASIDLISAKYPTFGEALGYVCVFVL